MSCQVQHIKPAKKNVSKATLINGQTQRFQVWSRYWSILVFKCHFVGYSIDEKAVHPKLISARMLEFS